MDGPPQRSYIERRQTRIPADGTLHESIVVTDGGAERLHSGERQADRTSST